MRKNDRLASNVITPTTKAEDHDVPISPAEIVAQGLMTQQEWDTVRAGVGMRWRGGVGGQQEEGRRRAGLHWFPMSGLTLMRTDARTFCAS